MSVSDQTTPKTSAPDGSSALDKSKDDSRSDVNETPLPETAIPADEAGEAEDLVEQCAPAFVPVPASQPLPAHASPSFTVGYTVCAQLWAPPTWLRHREEGLIRGRTTDEEEEEEEEEEVEDEEEAGEEEYQFQDEGDKKKGPKKLCGGPAPPRSTSIIAFLFVGGRPDDWVAASAVARCLRFAAHRSRKKAKSKVPTEPSSSCCAVVVLPPPPAPPPAACLLQQV